jgi:hypothetical protein
MISRADAMDLILKQIPAFRECWERHLRYWDGEEAGLCNDMAAFSHYVVDLISGDRLDGLDVIFNLVEQLLLEGDQELQDATATCFLENLLNASSSGKVDANKFADLLGTESRAYCRAWDRYTGVYAEETPVEFRE